MKKYILFLIGLTAFIGLSCEDNISPVDEYRERYVFYCILSGDGSEQRAQLSGSYKDGINTVDPFIPGAEIGMYWEGNAVFYRDTLVPRIDTSLYNTPFKYYYIKNYTVPINKEIEIEVMLPNGKRLSAKTTSPDTVAFPKNFSQFIPSDGNLLTYSWTPASYDNYVFPKLSFTYYKKVNGVFVKQGEKIVPLSYYESNGTYTAIYPKAQRQDNITYEVSALARALSEISQGDNNTNNYAVGIFVNLELKILDRNLSSYYSSSDASQGEYSINLDKTDYSNINGGFGVFGSYIVQQKRLFFVEEFIDQYGYSIIFNN